MSAVPAAVPDAAGAPPSERLIEPDRRRMRIAMLGTRGVPARYSGFETAIEEIGRRLAANGHHVTVYCRAPLRERQHRPEAYLGMRLVHLPAVHTKALETLTHTALAVVHAVVRGRPDAAFVFNSANSPWVPLLQWAGVPVAVHVDGLEWQRAKWGRWGRRYYRVAESLAVRRGDALIADAPGVAEYYRSEFGASTELIAYGAPSVRGVGADRIAELGLARHGYHLVVARLEPENHVLTIVRGYRVSTARLPLVVVGSAPYARHYIASIEAVARTDPRIRLLGSVWDQQLLDQLYANAALYLHGHSIGGTNPSLLRAIGASAPVAVFDVAFNGELVGDDGLRFVDERSVVDALEYAESNLPELVCRADRLHRCVTGRFRWDDIAAAYTALARRIVDGESRRGEASGRRPGLR